MRSKIPQGDRIGRVLAGRLEKNQAGAGIVILTCFSSLAHPFRLMPERSGLMIGDDPLPTFRLRGWEGCQH